MSTLDDYEVHVGDFGTEIGVTVKEKGVIVDLSAASAKTFKFRKPGGGLVEKAAQFKTDGTDGRLIYVVESGFLDSPGDWSGRVYLELGSWGGHSSRFTFDVLPAP